MEIFLFNFGREKSVNRRSASKLTCLPAMALRKGWNQRRNVRIRTCQSNEWIFSSNFREGRGGGASFQKFPFCSNRDFCLPCVCFLRTVRRLLLAAYMLTMCRLIVSPSPTLSFRADFGSLSATRPKHRWETFSSFRRVDADNIFVSFAHTKWAADFVFKWKAALWFGE